MILMDLSAWKKNSPNEQTYTGVVQNLRKVDNRDKYTAMRLEKDFEREKCAICQAIQIKMV